MPNDKLSYFNPRDNSLVQEHPLASQIELDQICLQASKAQKAWQQTSNQKRSQCLSKIATYIKENADELAKFESLDTGKPLETARQEVLAASKLWQYAADLIEKEQAIDQFHLSPDKPNSLIMQEPLGTVAMIVPWNYPLITTSERLPFALAAGCSVILKPSDQAIGCIKLLIDKISELELLPHGLVGLLITKGDELADYLIKHRYIDMVCFVGSSRIGQKVAATATEHGKHISTELGGNNFVLVYSDADIDKAANEIIKSGLSNAGQACVAGTHILVSPSMQPVLVEALAIALNKLYPLEEQRIQPVINQQQMHRIKRTIGLATSNKLPFLPASNFKSNGLFIGPIVFPDVPSEHEILKEEIFGPIITVTPLDEDEFITYVNKGSYGLAAYIWTSNNKQAINTFKQLKIGRVWVNAGSDSWPPELPVGGFKGSGHGRDLGPNALNTYRLSKSAFFPRQVQQ